MPTLARRLKFILGTYEREGLQVDCVWQGLRKHPGWDGLRDRKDAIDETGFTSSLNIIVRLALIINPSQTKRGDKGDQQTLETNGNHNTRQNFQHVQKKVKSPSRVNIGFYTPSWPSIVYEMSVDKRLCAFEGG